MIDIAFVEALVRILDESSLDNLEIRRGGTRVRLSKSQGVTSVPIDVERSPAPAAVLPSPEAPEAPGDANATQGAVSDALVEVTSPMVGTFYRAPSPGADPYVEEGGDVQVGDVLCVLEAMKLMNELECEVRGRIVEICVDNAEPVDFGQVLFRVDPAP